MRKPILLLLFALCSLAGHAQQIHATEVDAGIVNGALNPVACSASSRPSWCSGSDIGAWTNAAINQAYASCGEVYIPAGVYAQTTTITKPRCVRLHGASAWSTVLQWNSPTGIAVVLADSKGKGNYPEGELADMTLNGPGAPHSARAVFVGGDPKNVFSPSEDFGDHQDVTRVRIANFGANALTFGHNAFSDSFFSVILTSNGTCQIDFPPRLNNSGEVINFIGGGSQNSTGQGICQDGQADLFFEGFHCDYNASGCGTVAQASFHHVHFEQSGGAILAITTVGISPTVQITDSRLVLTGNAGNTTAMISVTPSHGLSPALVMRGNTYYVEKGQTLNNIVNFQGAGNFTLLHFEDVPIIHGSGRVLGVSSTACNFTGCFINDGAFDGLMQTGGNIRAANVTADGATECSSGNVKLAGWGAGATTNSFSGHSQTCQFTLVTGSGSFSSAPTVTFAFPNAFPAPVPCTMDVHGITGSGGAIIFNNTKQSATSPVFTASTLSGGSFTPATAETYIVVVRCGP